MQDICARNTFLDYPAPKPLTLQKAWTDPPPGLEEIVPAGEEAPPSEAAPPPLTLEAFVTPDSFEECLEPQLTSAASADLLASCFARREAPVSASELWSGTAAEGGFPPVLPLEKTDTYDPFESPCAAVEQVAATSALPPDTQGLQRQIVLEDVVPPILMPVPISPTSGQQLRLPPPPPVAPAPLIAELPEPEVPSAPPVDGLSAPPADGELQIGQLVCQVLANGAYDVHWLADARQLHTTTVRLVSSSFMLNFGAHCSKAFKVFLHPKVVINNKRGGGFKKAKGKGSIVLKCEAENMEGVPPLRVTFRVGRGSRMQQPRRVEQHNFAEQSCCSLPEAQQEWDFRSLVDEAFGSLTVSLRIDPETAWDSPSAKLRPR
eukprot:TRINITY_DN33667_c0_g1_i2.p1 TRINITY_DN33667_c0_g1~~TRINITY_DN33667_c0_g1_i2.p1  ORF type:complete len:377 (-),score=90.45 TRINITY_DN33667_c0_g1_i2:54-1184(-)